MQKDKTKVLSFFVKRYKVLKKNTDIFSVKNLENFAKILVMQKKGISYMQILKVGNIATLLS